MTTDFAGLYLHIPFCGAKCHYCNFVSFVATEAQKSAYVDCLLEEMSERRGEVDAVDTVYFGGGTPGRLPPALFERICCGIRKNFVLDTNTEFTFETNPDTVTKEYARTLKRNGVNRVSLGLQTANDRLLQEIGRSHRFEDFLRGIEILTDVGITNLSCDVMLALPGQSVTDVEDTVNQIARLPISHVSAYSLKPEPGTQMQHVRVDDDFAAELYEQSAALLAANGFLRYETSNFAKPGYACRHNLKYWTLVPYLGLGVAAHSDTRGRRSYNTDSFDDYLRGAPPVYQDISEEERKSEFIMLSLRLESGIDRKKYRERFGLDFVREHAAAVTELVKIGGILITDTRVKIPADKAYVANAIIGRFL